MSEHLTPLDATFLELEEADESAHMHIGGLLVFDPLPGGGAPSLDAVRRHLDERLGALPRYWQRLSEARTGGLTWPSWIHDEHFELADHVHRAVLPPPGGEPELTEWVSEYWSHRVDRHRPLWDTVLVEGLEHDRWALCTKTHHCMVDGVGSIDVGHLLLDVDPSHPEPPRPQRATPRKPSPGIAGRVSGAVAKAARQGAGAALHPLRMLERSRALAELIVRDELIAAPRASLNVPIGTLRRYQSVHVPLEDLKAVKRALGGTVNDVALTVVAGGLRRLLTSRGEQLPAQGLRAMVPVNVRDTSEQLALGNRITSLFLHIPVAEADARRRYELVHGDAEGAKSGSQGIGAETLIELTGQMPPVVHSALARSLYASRLFNLTITNVPGPQLPLYALGARMVRVDALVPLAAEHCVGVAILSYAGDVSFGLIADRDTVPDLDVLAHGIRDSIAELRRVAARQADQAPA